MESKVKVGLKQIGLAAALVASLGVSVAHAEDASTSDTSPGLTLKLEPAHHKFMRFSYIYIKPNTKTSPTQDKTGPVVSAADVQCLKVHNCAGYVYTHSGDDYNFGYTLDSTFPLEKTGSNGIPEQANGIGLPTGIGGDAQGAGSLAISAGLFFDEQHEWSLEAYVFALPFNNTVNGTGSVTEIDTNTGAITRVRPNAINGQAIIRTKQLPPTFVFSHYWGGKDATFRPFLGLGVTYAMFFDTHSTELLDQYSGGPTDVKLKNAFGAGPFAGLQYRMDEKWHLAVQLGYVKLKTTATLSTRTDAQTLADSPVLQDFSGYVGAVNRGVYGSAAGKQIVANVLQDLQTTRGGSLGPYVRTMDSKLDPYIMTLSVGYDF